MIVIMQPGATPEEVDAVKSEIQRFGFRPFENPGVERKVIAVLGEVDMNKAELVEQLYSKAAARNARDGGR